MLIGKISGEYKTVNRPINVLHVIQGKHFGGAEQVVLTLAKCFTDYVAPKVLCLSQGLLLEKLTQSNIPNFLIPMGSKTDIPIPLVKTIRLIKEQDIDIVHTHTVRANCIGRLAAFITGRKCVTHLHSPILRDFADLKRGRINEFIDSLTRFVANRYIAVSYNLRNEMIQRGMSPDKIVTIHNALDLDSLRLSNKNDVPRIRKKFNIPEDASVLALIALLRPRKGVDLLIEAMKTVVEHSPDIYLLVVGNDDISEDPDYGDKLRRMSCELGIKNNVVFIGFQNDVPAILRESNVMVLPSRFGEGLPMVILESMVVGVPVIASNIEGIPEIITDGVNGFLVDAGDVVGLAEKIIQVLENKNLLKKVAKSAQEKVFAEMNGFEQAQKVEEVYRHVLAG